MGRQTPIDQAARLVLGTAQLGMPYGIANTSGQPDEKMADAIVADAWAKGIREYDTAQAYGESEQVLGRALSRLKRDVEPKIISKLHPAIDGMDPKEIHRTLERSLEHLGVERLHGLLLHNENQLDQWDTGLGELMHEVVESGKVRHIGVSVYSPEKAIAAIRISGIDVVQLPSSIVDQRFEKAGVYDLGRKAKKQLYIRSVFLQGLLLMDEVAIPRNMGFATKTIYQFKELAEQFNLTRQELSLGYVASQMGDSKIIFGAEHPSHIEENLEALKTHLPMNAIRRARELFESTDDRIVCPTLWPRQ